MSAISPDVANYNLATKYISYSFNKKFDKFVRLLSENVTMEHTTNGVTKKFTGRDEVAEIYRKNLFEAVSNFWKPHSDIHSENDSLWFTVEVIQTRNNIPVQFEDHTRLYTTLENGQLKIKLIQSEVRKEL